MNVISAKSKSNAQKSEKFFMCHPYAAFWTIFIGLPTFILVAVFVTATAILLPVSWLLGWL